MGNGNKDKPLIQIDYKELKDRIQGINEQLTQKASKKKVEGVVNLSEHISETDTSHDQAFQRANDACRQDTIISGIEKAYTIKVPSGKYVINQEIKISPYVKLKSEGYVVFSVTFNGTAFHITPDVNDPKYDSTSPDLHLFKNSWNRGEYFDGSNGGFIFTTTLDNHDSTTKTVAIEIGSRDSTSSVRTPTSRYVVENVNVYGFDIAILNNAVNNYIGTFKHCHLELNNHSVKFLSPATGTQVNSGENFVFDNFDFCFITNHVISLFKCFCATNL
jgi:hypothetical protein